MPLPISASTYIHNPLTGVEATKAGKAVGSEFSNFVEGLFTGAEKGIGISKGLQELELAPREQARREQATQLEQERIALEQQREDRLANNQEFEQDFKGKDLAIREADLRRKQDLTAARISRMRTTTALASQRQAADNILEGAMTDVIVSGSFDSTSAIFNGDDPRLKGQFIEKVIRDKELGQAYTDKVQGLIESGKLSAEDTMRANALVDAIGAAASISTTREYAETGRNTLLNELGAAPMKGNYFDWDQKTGEIWERSGDGRLVSRKPVTKITKEDAKGRGNWADVDRSLAAVQRAVEVEKIVSQASMKVAETRAQEVMMPQQDEQPTKISKTPAQRAGLSASAGAITKVGGELTADQLRKRREGRKRIEQIATPEGRSSERQKKNIKRAAVGSLPVIGPVAQSLME